MAIANTNWYRNGTISIANNATKVYGSGTQWLSAGINPGATLRIDGTYHALEILAVVSDTEIDLRVAYTGESVTNAAYSIDRNFQSTLPADIAAGVANMTGKYERYIDSDLQKITGESAYDIAVKNGFVGTESQWLESLSAYGQAKKNGYTGTLAEWLESLKAAGEWSNADSRLAALEAKLAYFPDMQPAFARHYHNIYPRFKDLGTTITAAQYAALENGSYDDLFVGDYWRLTVDGSEMWAIIVQLGNIGGRLDSEETANKYRQFAYGNHYKGAHIMLSTGRTGYHMNDTNTTEGGYKGSKMHTEILPELAEQLAAAIGSEHILNVYRWMSTSNTVDANGNPPKENIESKLELPEMHNIRFTDYITNNPGGVPWALFQLPILGTNTPLYDVTTPRLATWLRDVATNYQDKTAFLYTMPTNIYGYQSAGFNWHRIAPHFVLVP